MLAEAGKQETGGLLGRATTTALANIRMGPQASGSQEFERDGCEFTSSSLASAHSVPAETIASTREQ